MNIAPFYELRTRLYASAASGCGTINEDFRLKRAVEAFEPLAGANKAFMKLYTDCGKLFTSDAPADILPDCIALADALAVTQGNFGESTEAVPSEIKAEMKIMPARYSVVSSLCEKIRKRGPGLTKLSSDEIKLISDGRIISEFIKASEKNNSNLDSFAECFIGIWGKAVVPMLKNAVDLTDENASGTRIKYIFMATGTDENDYYVSLAKNTEAPQNIRTAAIEAMGYCPENAGLLSELCRTEKGKVRDAAITAVMMLNTPEADGILAKLIEKSKGDYTKYARYVKLSSSRTAEEFVRAQIKETSETLRSKDKSKLIMPVENTVELFRNKIGIADCFLEAAELSRLWGGGKRYETNMNSRLNDVLIQNLKNEDNEKYRRLITELYEKSPDEFIPAYFFMKFIDDPTGAIAELSNKLEKHHILVSRFLMNISYSHAQGKYYTPYFYSYYHTDNGEGAGKAFLFESFPDSILKFMCSFSDLSNSAEDIARSLREFVRGCAPYDRERVVSAVLDAAFTVAKKSPQRACIDLIAEYCPEYMSDRCIGVVSEYIMYMLMNNAVDHCSVINNLPLSDSEKTDELIELLNRVSTAKGNFTESTRNTLLSDIRKEIQLIERKNGHV